ncbi:hypothetical protein [Actinomycetospora sp.]|jgi:hypothetical protein|uniref:hypothetical protein n=1 Tax=Actinomycetospora sp. TaxID=1872135 RepID=UPI002F3E4729
MTTDLMDVRVEDYSSRRPSDAPSPVRESGVDLPISGLLALSIALTAFVAVAVYFSQLAGAC